MNKEATTQKAPDPRLELMDQHNKEMMTMPHANRFASPKSASSGVPGN